MDNTTVTFNREQLGKRLVKLLRTAFTLGVLFGTALSMAVAMAAFFYQNITN